jgi:hypothetical protein
MRSTRASRTRPRRAPSLALAALGIALVALPAAADWPRYRGEDASGRSAERGLLADWPESGPPEL